MGNSQSNEEAKSPASAQKPLRHRESKASVKRHAAAASQSQQAAAKPLAAQIVPASSTASTSTSNAHAQGATAAQSPSSTHSRARSITTTATTTSKIRPEDIAASGKSDQAAMGNTESKPPSRAATLPPISTTSEDKSKASPVSRPVDVPQSHDGQNDRDTFSPSGVPGLESPYAQSNAPRYDRPPRLPLPIEEEPLTPGSPILSPQHDLPRDISAHSEHQESEGTVPRRASMLSSTTADDEDDGDNDAFAPEQSQGPQVLVPTPVHYKGPGEKVYVTGTFVNWERKFKLHRHKEKGGGFSATLQLQPGTHHIKFLVDGDMVTNDELPTTVDYTNILVNYIEVVAPLPGTQQKPAPAKPMDIPGAALTAGQATATGEPAARPLDIRTQARAPETEADLPSTLSETVAAPETKKSESIPVPKATQTPPKPTERRTPPPQKKAVPKKKVPRPQYTSSIPSFFLDQDLNDPQDESYQRASKVVQNLPQPPTLPMFLGKSILNATTPHKDDASVLTMPNHTVLNHLATSSIKNGVLATSGTTRYKRKFLTTIMHKPTSDDG